MSEASGSVRQAAEPGDSAIRAAVIVTALASLLLARLESYVLFHTVAELYTVAVALGICAVAWNTRGHGRADFLKVLGVGFACSGALDLLHALSYPDLGLFPGYPAQLPTQFWIAARLAQAAALVAAPLFFRRRIDTRLLVFGAGTLLLAAVALILAGRFPDCFVPDRGMTRFKIVSEYAVIALCAVSLLLFLRRRRSLDPRALAMIAGSLVLTMGAEVAFTAYATFYDDVHLTGHVLRLAAYYLLCRALLVAGLRTPLDLVFFSLALDRVGEAAFLVSATGRIEYANEEACRSLGYGEDELLRMTVGDVDPDLAGEGWAAEWRALAGGTRLREGRRRAKDGRTFPVEISTSHLVCAGRGYAVALARDVSDRLRVQAEREHLRDQLAHAERLDAIGRLAGGVAHDLNNVLMPVLGYAELLLAASPDGSEQAQDLAELKRAAERARELTGQLLAFGQRQVLELRPVDLRGRVARMETLLRATLRPDVHVQVRVPRAVGAVRADPGQLDQVLMTLAVTAQRAMPRGGVLSLEVADVEVTPAHPAAARGVAPGRWVTLAVSDTGEGLDEERLRHVFEPFYASRTARVGTGLGVSIVHGIVTQHGGVVYAESAPGRGTTFRIFLPRDAREAPVAPAPEGGAVRAGAGEAIVLADDEAMVRAVTRRMLEGLGYRVVVAGEADVCLRFVQEQDAAVDLLVTDAVMPRLDGRQLHERLVALRPGLPVVYMSGYAGDVLAASGVPGGAVLLAKPFTVDALRDAVQRALRGGRGTGASAA